jgi:hypothetical protein
MRRGTQVGKGGLNLTHSRVRTLLKFIAPCKAKLFLIFLLSLTPNGAVKRHLKQQQANDRDEHA